METINNAVMLDEDKLFTRLYRHFLGQHNYQIFTTSNPYKLLLYGREIKPEILFAADNLSRRNQWELIKRLHDEPWMQDVPIIIMSEDTLPEDPEMSGISNIFAKRNALEKMIEFLEIYCRGNKEHDCLVLADYTATIHDELDRLKQHRRNCFLTHDLTGSQKYLSKNHTKKIAIKYSPERFENIKDNFSQTNPFRIDSLSEIEHTRPS